jgi:hypothetical protein
MSILLQKDVFKENLLERIIICKLACYPENGGSQ